MITQDFVKGLDLTGQNAIGATQLNQMVDLARTGSDKGLVLWTEDTALNTPDVPNPDANIGGVFPIWWKRYVWVRKLFNAGSYAYVWDGDATPDATYLNWIRVDLTSDTALTAANNAASTANDAAADASEAKANAQDALTEIADLTTRLATAETTITAQAAQITALQTNQTIFRTGDSRESYRSETYSKAEDQGWLEEDGSAVSRTIFANLFAEIGTTFGAGDGSSTFNIPDSRGRVGVGAGQGTSLTNRQLGQSGGEESHVLLTNELANHTHVISGAGYTGSGNFTPHKTLVDDDYGAADTALTDATGNDVGHNNMQPFIVRKCFIKT